MKIKGSHKFKATSERVYNAILDPDRIRADIAINLPGVNGTFGAIIRIAERQEPNKLTLQVQRQGKAGSIDATSEIDIADDADGALLSYNANADLSGAIAIANNPIGQGITKNTLNSFFEKLGEVLHG